MSPPRKSPGGSSAELRQLLAHPAGTFHTDELEALTLPATLVLINYFDMFGLEREPKHTRESAVFGTGFPFREIGKTIPCDFKRIGTRQGRQLLEAESGHEVQIPDTGSGLSAGQRFSEDSVPSVRSVPSVYSVEPKRGGECRNSTVAAG